MKQIEVSWKQLGGHVHCRFYTGYKDQTFACCGELIFDEREWPEIRAKLARIATLAEAA